MSNLETLLKDFGIDFPEVINQITLYETLNKVADKWDEMQKDKDELEQVSFKAKCNHPDVCCCECEEMYDCEHTCYTYKFDCPDCYKQDFRM